MKIIGIIGIIGIKRKVKIYYAKIIILRTDFTLRYCLSLENKNKKCINRNNRNNIARDNGYCYKRK